MRNVKFKLVSFNNLLRADRGDFTCFETANLLSLTPFVPVYNLSGEFISIGRVTMQGLVLFSLYHFYNEINGNKVTLNHYKVYADVPRDNIVDLFLVEDYTVDDSLKPLIAIPCAMHPANSPYSLTLYNMRNKKVLSFRDMRDKDSVKEFEEAIPYIENIDVQGDDTIIFISDDTFSFDKVTGTTEERELWTLSYPSVTKGNLTIDEPSAEYRLVCPSFDLDDFHVTEQTGAAKLHVYNLPSYNTLNVDADNSATRLIHLYDSCRGSIRLFNDIQGSAINTCNLTLLADGTLNSVFIKTAKTCDARLNVCNDVVFNNICKLRLSMTRANSLMFSAISDFSDAEIKDAGSVLFRDTDINNVTILDTKADVAFTYCHFNNSKIDGAVNLDMLYGAHFDGVEIRNVHYLSLETGSYKDTTVYMNDNAVLSMSALGTNPPSGTIDVVLESDVLNFCSLVTSTNPYTSYNSNTFYEPIVNKLGTLYEAESRFGVNVIRSSFKTITLRYTIYLNCVDLDILLRGPRASLSLLVLHFAMLDLKFPEGTTAKLELDVKCLTDAVMQDFCIDLDSVCNLTLDDIKFRSDCISLSGHDNFMSEFSKEYAEYGSMQDIANNNARCVFDMLDKAGVTEISVNIPTERVL